MKKYRVKVSRKKGWKVYGYFEVDNDSEVRKIINDINGYFEKQSIDEYFKLGVNDIEEVTDDKKKWEKKKAIGEYMDWVEKQSKLPIFDYETNGMLVLSSFGIGFLVSSFLFLFFDKELTKLLTPNNSLFYLAHSILIYVGITFLLLALKKLNGKMGTNISVFIFIIMSFILFVLIIKNMDNNVIKYSLVYAFMVLVITISIVAITRIVNELLKLFTQRVPRVEERLTILIAVFGTIISLIALFK